MKYPLLGSNSKQCLPLLPLLGLSIDLFNRQSVNNVYHTQDWRSLLKLFNSIMSGGVTERKDASVDALPYIGYQSCPQLHSSPCRSGCSLPRCEAQDWGQESSER